MGTTPCYTILYTGASCGSTATLSWTPCCRPPAHPCTPIHHIHSREHREHRGKGRDWGWKQDRRRARSDVRTVGRGHAAVAALAVASAAGAVVLAAAAAALPWHSRSRLLDSAQCWPRCCLAGWPTQCSGWPQAQLVRLRKVAVPRCRAQSCSDRRRSTRRAAAISDTAVSCSCSACPWYLETHYSVDVE